MQNIKPEKSHSKQKQYVMSNHAVGNPAEFGFSCMELGREMHTTGPPKISAVRKVVRLLLVTMIFLSNRKPVKKAGTGNEFSSNQL